MSEFYFSAVCIIIQQIYRDQVYKYWLIDKCLHMYMFMLVIYESCQKEQNKFLRIGLNLTEEIILPSEE